LLLPEILVAQISFLIRHFVVSFRQPVGAVVELENLHVPLTNVIDEPSNLKRLEKSELLQEIVKS
jgi:hypothetical protein